MAMALLGTLGVYRETKAGANGKTIRRTGEGGLIHRVAKETNRHREDEDPKLRLKRRATGPCNEEGHKTSPGIEVAVREQSRKFARCRVIGATAPGPESEITVIDLIVRCAGGR